MRVEKAFKNVYWIGIPDSLYDEKNSTDWSGIRIAYFRCILDLADSQDEFFISISASSRFRMWVNDYPVLSGPCRGDRWRHYFDKVDIGSFLRKGQNIIAVKVVAYPMHNISQNESRKPQWIMPSVDSLCLIVKRCKDKDDGFIEDIDTGSDKWKVCLDEAVRWVSFPLSDWIGPMEKVMGEKLPHGWKNSIEPKGNWVDPIKLWLVEGMICGHIPPLPLVERPIPLLYERKRRFVGEMPIRIGDYECFSFMDRNSSNSLSKVHIKPMTIKVIELDAGELTTGYLQIYLDGGKGSRVTIRYAECYSEYDENGRIIKGVRNDAEQFRILGHEDVYYPSGNNEAYEPFLFKTFRFIRMEIATKEDALTIYPPIYYETGYPLEVSSCIEASAEWVKPLWDISIRTLQRCMHETYEDCPYYEQTQYAWDTRLQILYTYMLSSDTRLALRTIEDFNASLIPEGILQSRYPCSDSQVIPAFALQWIMMLEDYYWQTGDSSVPKRYRPTVDAILDWYDRKIGKCGLVEKLGYWMFIDWVEEWEKTGGEPPASLCGPSTIHNLIYAQALQSASRLSRLTGRTGTADEYEQRAYEILNVINNYCRSDKTGLFMEGPQLGSYSQHAQVWAVLTGLVKDEDAVCLMEKMLDFKSMVKCSVSSLYYLFRALEKTGLYGRTEPLWKIWTRFLPLNITTWPENLLQSSGGRSECHAWSSLPIFEFSSCILGVKPLLPGWEKIMIKPVCTYLNDARGKVATPKGIVHVEWNYSHGKLSISGETPLDVPVELQLPDGSIIYLPNGGRFKY